MATTSEKDRKLLYDDSSLFLYCVRGDERDKLSLL